MDLSIYSDIELHGLMLEIGREIERRTVVNDADQKLEASVRKAIDAGVSIDKVMEIADRVGKGRGRDREEPEPPVEEPSPAQEDGASEPVDAQSQETPEEAAAKPPTPAADKSGGKGSTTVN